MSWFVNVAFMEQYYIEHKVEDLVKIYNQVSLAFDTNGIIDTRAEEELLINCETKSVSVIVVDYSMKVKFMTGYSIGDDELKNRLGDIIFEDKGAIGKIVVEADNYTIHQFKDENTNVEYIEMFGDMSNGNIYVMRVAVESIREIVDISNGFFANVLMLVLLLSIIVTIVISVKITRPILTLVHISERMSKLDFNIKYESDSDDELSVLGNSMNKLSEKLESTIAELKTANVQLQKDIEEKNEIDKMRKEFVSNVSHELKTPIALIQGYAEGLKEGVSDDAESREFYCDVIIDEAAKMNKMVMKLISLNQIESGKSKVEMVRFDIITLIDSVLNSTSILLKEKGADVYFDNTQEIYVWTDEFQTQEIITNYLSNAINHLGNDNIIRITTDVNAKRVRVGVYNSGEHIPEEEIDKIWDKFYKVDKARTREYGGSGIGLSIVKAIAEQLGMKCGVKNVLGGVEFYIEISC